MNKFPYIYLRNQFNLLGLFLVFLLGLSGCVAKIPDEVSSVCLVKNRPCLKGKAVVQIMTNRGTIYLELDGDAAPVTAGNFLDLVNKGVYEKTVFHRVIKIPSPFVVKGGDPLSKDLNTSKINYGQGNFIDPTNGEVRFIPLEIKLTSEDVPRYNQIITNTRQLSELVLSHQRGSFAMARSQTLGSGSAQFYIALKPLPQLDGRYSVFGKIIEGFDVLDNLIEGDIILKTNLAQSK